MVVKTIEDNIRAFEFNQAINKRIMALCKPLFDNIGLSSFAYSKLYDDGRYLFICSNLKWTEHRIKRHLWDCPSFSRERTWLLKRQRCKFIVSGVPNPNDLILSDLFEQNIWNAVNLYYKRQGAIEVFSLGGTRDQESLCDFYGNNDGLLDKFTHYFIEKSKDLLKDAAFTRFETIQPEITPQSSPFDDAIELASRQISASRYYLCEPFQDVYLTTKEAMCMFHLSHGKTYKETGNLLKISDRTVEQHVENIKKKTGILTKSGIIDLFLASQLNDTVGQ